MTQITAREVGRKLHITVGEPGEDDTLVFVIKPMPSGDGASLLALWAGIAFTGTEKPETDALDLAHRLITDEQWEDFNSLRAAESSAVVNAAFFWNVQGGGIELVNEMLQDGLPKAQTTLASASGFATELSALTTLLNGAAENAIPAPADTSATSTPVGTSGSFGATRTPQDPA